MARHVQKAQLAASDKKNMFYIAKKINDSTFEVQDFECIRNLFLELILRRHGPGFQITGQLLQD